jgi:hypothetical protein
LSLADEHVGDVTIPTQVIEYNQHFLLADYPIRLEYSNQIKLLSIKSFCTDWVNDLFFIFSVLTPLSAIFHGEQL